MNNIAHRFAAALVLYHLFAFSRSFIRSVIFILSSSLSSLAGIKVICLIQDMSYQSGKACDAGLAFDLARTLGPTAMGGGCLPITATLLLFPPISDLPVPSVLP